VNTLRISTPAQEGVLRVSKWLKHQVLLSAQEMESLFLALSPFSIYVVSELVSSHNGLVSHAEFLEKYAGYVNTLKEGKVPDEAPLRRYFSAIFTETSDILYAMQTGPDKFLIKALKPVIQLQGHHFFFSRVDQKYHSMVLGKESVTWGLQFSYPQIYQDPKDHSFSKVVDSPYFPNTALFTRLAKWLRGNTMPTPLMAEGKRTNVPIRIGKQCLEWIDRHPHLIAQDISLCLLKS
jgi:hypothetical protein